MDKLTQWTNNTTNLKGMVSRYIKTQHNGQTY